MKNFLLASAFLLSACNISDKPKTLKGQVLENSTNRPVANACVTLSSLHKNSRNNDRKMDLISGFTDHEGRYSFSFDWDKHQDYCLIVTSKGFFGEFGEHTTSEFKDKNPVFNIMLRPEAYIRLHLISRKGHSKVSFNLPESGQFEFYSGTDTTFVALMEGGIAKSYSYFLYDKNLEVESSSQFTLNIEPHDTTDYTIEF